MKLRYRSLKQWKYETLRVYAIQTPITGFDILVDYITLRPDGTLVIDGRYAYDGVTGGPDLGSAMIAALVHDAFYQLMRLGLIPLSCRQVIDKLFYDICIWDGMAPVIAATYYGVVRALGVFFCKPETEPEQKIYEVGA